MDKQPPKNSMKSSSGNEPSIDQKPTMPVSPSAEATVMQHPDGHVMESPKTSWVKWLGLGALIIALVGGAYVVIANVNNPKTANQAVASKKKDIAQLNFGLLNTDSSQIYPTFSVSDGQFTINAQMFEGLVKYVDENKIVPNLATGWSNPDNSTWDFDLKKGVNFHTGRTMTASDVVASFEGIKQNKDYYDTFGSTISEVKALNDYRVEIKTTDPDPFLLNKLTYLMVYDTKSGKTADPVNGTGPYTIKSGTTPTAKKLELTAYDNYHGGHSYTRALNFMSYDNEEAIAADFKKGVLNLGGEFASSKPEQLNGLNYKTLPREDTAVTMIIPNTVKTGPLQKLEVRQAITAAMDVPQLISEGKIEATQASQLMVKALPGYNPSIKAPTRDVAKAKDLLSKAGYAKGFTLTLSATPVYEASINTLTKQLAEVGITLKYTRVSDLSTLVKSMIAGKNEMTLLSYSSDVLDGSDVLSSVVTDSNFKNTEFTSKLTEAASTLDQAKRLQILQAATKITSDNVAVVPLFNRKRIWVTDKAYVIPQDMPSLSFGCYFWQVYQE